MKTLVIAIFPLFLLAADAIGAEFEDLSVPGIDQKFIRLSGPIIRGDADRFVQITRGLDRLTVIPEGPGGSVKEALEIGAEIRIKGWATIVLPGSECASACALIWISGARRYMSRDSRIGFHAVYDHRRGVPMESGMGNAEVGSFLTHLGLRIEAIRFITAAGPDNLLFLTPERARILGIEIYENDGFDVILPSENPVVDVYVQRFHAYSVLSSQCVELLNVDRDVWISQAEDSFRKGHQIVTAEQWARLLVQAVDEAKAATIANSRLQFCIYYEEFLRKQGRSTGINGPSFDCKRASLPAEFGICASPGVWASDRALSYIYNYVRSLQTDPAIRRRIVRIQREWLKYRNSCGADSDCLRTVYSERLNELKNLELAVPMRPTIRTSFDCGRAGNQAEFAICSDPDLANLDLEMARLYRASRTRLKGKHLRRLLKQQARWLRQRNECASDRACLAASYGRQIRTLQQQ